MGGTREGRCTSGIKDQRGMENRLRSRYNKTRGQIYQARRTSERQETHDINPLQAPTIDGDHAGCDRRETDENDSRHGPGQLLLRMALIAPHEELRPRYDADEHRVRLHVGCQNWPAAIAMQGRAPTEQSPTRRQRAAGQGLRPACTGAQQRQSSKGEVARTYSEGKVIPADRRLRRIWMARGILVSHHRRKEKQDG